MGFAVPCHSLLSRPGTRRVGMKGEILTLGGRATSREIFADFPGEVAVYSPTTPTVDEGESLTARFCATESRGGGDAHGRGDSRRDGARGGNAAVLPRRARAGRDVGGD